MGLLRTGLGVVLLFLTLVLVGVGAVLAWVLPGLALKASAVFVVFLAWVLMLRVAERWEWP